MTSTVAGEPPIIAQDTSYLMQCPPEILSLIFDPVNVDKKELLTRGPLCSDLKPFFNAQLFHDISLLSLDHVNELYEALWQKSRKERQEVGKLVRSFTFINLGHSLKRIQDMTVDFQRLMELFKSLKSIRIGNSWASHALLLGIEQYQSLQSIELHLKVSDAVSVYELLEPFKKLPNLKSVDLILDCFNCHSIPEDINDSTLPSQLRSIRLEGLGNLFLSSPYFIHFASQLPALHSLGIKSYPDESSPTCEIAQFLFQLDSSKLETLSLTSNEEFLESRDTIDDFLAQAISLKTLILGMPVLSNLSGIKFTNLERLELKGGAGVSFQNLSTFISNYSIERSDQEEGAEEGELRKPLKIELNEVELGHSEENMPVAFWDEYDLSLNPDIIEIMDFFDREGWSTSEYHGDYDFGEMGELILNARRTGGVEIVGEAVEAVENDNQYYMHASILLDWMEEMKRDIDASMLKEYEEYLMQEGMDLD